ncbi:FHA domain-containing protein [archaeon]|jgi:hypothetical protein|nr:FHA domain-containing protein [archaeon]MBT4397105.1 FHA domain-containing protein [archaeon]MBT4441168.1 FHA domain-containing protein [archaeon]
MRRRFILGDEELIARAFDVERLGDRPELEILIIGQPVRGRPDAKGANLEFVYPLGTKVMVPSEDGMYQLQEGGLYLPIDQEGIVFGRGNAGADIQIGDSQMSKLHARLSYDKSMDRLVVRDLGSSNGTMVDRGRVYHGERTVDFGSKIKMGRGYVSVLGPQR